MARVNHKQIRQLIAQKQKTITDRQFFTSRAFATYFSDIAAAQTRRYGYRRRIKVHIIWKPKDDTTAQTNNELVLINAGHPSITRCKSRQDRFAQICGLFAHELGHVLYTDFLASQTYHSYLETGRWFPEPPPTRNSYERTIEAECRDTLCNDPIGRKLLGNITHEILNVLEDGYIEQRVLSDYPGILGSNLHIRRASAFEAMPDLAQIIEAEPEDGHIWLTILQAILSYMKWGEIKYGGTPLSDERIQVVFSMLGELDQALISPDFRDRCRTANLILIRCWPYIVDFLDFCKDRAEKLSASGSTGDSSGVLHALLSKLAGSSSEAVGTSAPVEGSESGSSGEPTEKRRAATAKLAEGSGSHEEAESTEPESPTTMPEPESPEEPESPATLPEADSDAESDEAESSDAPVDSDSSSGDLTPPGEPSAVSHEEGGRIPLTDTDILSTPEGGSIDRDDEYQGTNYENAAADIERLLEAIAENSVCTELERQRTKELTELAQSISYGNIHNGVSMTVHRIAEVPDTMKEQYREISGDLLRISKQLQKSVLHQLQDSRRGGKQTSLLMGRRLDTHSLCRNDGRVFYKNALPNETPALSVGLLLDESGSMSFGSRATYARATAIILYDFCHALGIPIMVCGHSESSGVDLYSYAEFESIDQDDRYRLMDISARGNNRDGAALRYMAERLSRRPEDIKLLILVSDGQPCGTGYHGTSAEEDLRGIKQEYQRKNILFVAAAIGSDKENIERIYGESFLDITDLNKLPVKLAGIIKRFIRV